MKSTFDELKDLIDYIQSVYTEITDEWLRETPTKTNLKNALVADIDADGIIFDEFSKYIEGHAVEGFAGDMKVLQDMCELCNASKDEQLHLTCVAHKSIKTYGSALPAEILNSFKGVEGRLKEVYGRVRWYS